MDISLYFLIKKTVALFILPSSIILFLLFFSFLLSFKKKHILVSKLLFFLGISLYFIFSFPPTIHMLLNPLTDIKTIGYNHSEVKSAAVLLAGVNYDYEQKNKHQLSPISQIRVNKAVELANSKSLNKIYLSGGCEKPLHNCPVSEAEVAGDFLKNKIKNTTIVLETLSSDTFSNLYNLKKIIGNEPFYLITSPTHIKRAKIIADNLNLNAYPVTSNNFQKTEWNLWTLWPSSESLYLADMIFHEYYGIIWFYLREKL